MIKNKKQDKEINPEQFGVPNPGYTPMKTIEMEGELFRGITKRKPRTLFLRISMIVFSVLFFIIPGLFGIYLGYLSLSDQPGLIFSNIAPLAFSILWTIAGLIGIYSNIKK